MQDDVLISEGLDLAAAAELKARAFAFSSLKPRAADVLRRNSAPLEHGSYSAKIGSALVGSVSLWPIALHVDGMAHQLILLGPLMVDPDMQGQGLGKALMKRAIGAVDQRSLRPVMLIGDEAYYRQFGFFAAPTQQWSLPGVAARSRVLVRSSEIALPAHGTVLAAFAPPAGKQTAA
ncbi:MAG: N-acetyltransferase [Pseudomonadota bacterium]